jgi:hypothetical protein
MPLLFGSPWLLLCAVMDFAGAKDSIRLGIR